MYPIRYFLYAVQVTTALLLPIGLALFFFSSDLALEVGSSREILAFAPVAFFAFTLLHLFNWRFWSGFFSRQPYLERRAASIEARTVIHNMELQAEIKYQEAKVEADITIHRLHREKEFAMKKLEYDLAAKAESDAERSL